jgi:DNA helicase TIP49 (TBP-interacting protein)
MGSHSERNCLTLPYFFPNWCANSCQNIYVFQIFINKGEIKQEVLEDFNTNLQNGKMSKRKIDFPVLFIDEFYLLGFECFSILDRAPEIFNWFNCGYDKL